MNRRQICTIIGCFFALVVLFNAANAQSKRIDNPTPLTSNEISGVIDKNTKDDTYYYYSFLANPGAVKVTITVESNTNIVNLETSNLISAELVLYDSNSELIAKKAASSSSNLSGKGAAEAEVQIAKRQTLILGIKLLGGRYFDGLGKYKIRIDGADINEPNNTSTDCNDFRASLSGENSISFPEKGTLIMSFVKGAMMINLSSVKGISICGKTNRIKTKELNYGKINLAKEGIISISMKDGGAMSLDLSQISSVDILR